MDDVDDLKLKIDDPEINENGTDTKAVSVDSI